MAGEELVTERGWFKVYQGGIEVAGGTGPYEAIQREADHYVMMYAMDGDVNVRIQRIGERRKQQKYGVKDAP